jgi:hypothetical protein
MESLMGVNRSLLSVAAIVAAAAITAPAALVQAQQQPQGQQREPAAAVTDSDIVAFVAAATEVRQLNQSWVPRVQEAAKKGKKEEEEVRKQALEELTQAVQKNGLSVDRYQEIYAIAQSDPEVARKVREKMPPPASRQ